MVFKLRLISLGSLFLAKTTLPVFANNLTARVVSNGKVTLYVSILTTKLSKAVGCSTVGEPKVALLGLTPQTLHPSFG